MMINSKKHHSNVAIFVPHAGCPHQCSFCNQKHIAGQTAFPTAQAVRTACETAQRTLRPGMQAQIAFFGGSFTAIPQQDMIRLLAAAEPFVESGAFAGIRVSTRPDAVDSERLALLRQYGVTTVELGAQSMNDTVLARCGRGHTSRDVAAASALVHQAGLSLGLQMMTGLPASGAECDEQTAMALAALHPDEVRIYPTLVVEGTPLAEEYRRGEYIPQTLEQAVTLCARLLKFFEDECHIPVIRLGLHAEQEMMRHCLAGPWHPAFRELCEGRIYREKVHELLKQCRTRDVELRVHPTDVSRVVGHKKENIRFFAEAGYRLVVKPDEKALPSDSETWLLHELTMEELQHGSESVRNTRF